MARAGTTRTKAAKFRGTSKLAGAAKTKRLPPAMATPAMPEPGKPDTPQPAEVPTAPPEVPNVTPPVPPSPTPPSMRSAPGFLDRISWFWRRAGRA